MSAIGTIAIAEVVEIPNAENAPMNPADEMAAKIGSVERQSAGAAAGLIDEAGVTYKLDEQLRVSVELYYIQILRENLWRNWMTFFWRSVITSIRRRRFIIVLPQ